MGSSSGDLVRGDCVEEGLADSDSEGDSQVDEYPAQSHKFLDS